MISQDGFATGEWASYDSDDPEFGDGMCDACGSRIRSKCERGYDHCVVCSGGDA